MRFFKALLLLSVTLLLSSCGSDDDSGGGAQGGSGEVSAETTQVNNPGNTRASESGITKTDYGRYHGRHNGNRGTWYFPRNMSSYPSTFDVSISGCSSFTVNNNNGRRYTTGGYIVKQSDVPGRGLALVAPASCGSRSARITFVQK
jgi:uncharacterized protein YceK